jgi:hypothetical protein
MASMILLSFVGNLKGANDKSISPQSNRRQDEGRDEVLEHGRPTWMFVSHSSHSYSSTPIMYKLTISSSQTNSFYPDAPHSHSYALLLEKSYKHSLCRGNLLFFVYHNNEYEMYRLPFSTTSQDGDGEVRSEKEACEYIYA